jgi:hypothetical protein
MPSGALEWVLVCIQSCHLFPSWAPNLMCLLDTGTSTLLLFAYFYETPNSRQIRTWSGAWPNSDLCHWSD